MIDFHSHILPGMDDGSKSVPQSVSMLRELARQGVDTVVLSSHFYARENSPAQFLQRRKQAWQQLNPHLEPEFPDLCLGAEVQYFDGISAVEEILDLRVEGTNYLLLEMPFHHWPERVIDEVLDLSQWQDVQLVLAHFERYVDMQPKTIWQLFLDSGIQLQSNVSYFGTWKTRRRATKLLEDGKIHFLGSDCHNTTTRPPNWDLLPKQARALAEHSPSCAEFRRQRRRWMESFYDNL